MDLRSVIGCSNLNCSGSTTDSHYNDSTYNAQYVAPNQAAYNGGKNNLKTGYTDDEFRNKNLVSERIGKGAIAVTGCVLTGAVGCKTAASSIGVVAGFDFAADKPVTGTDVVVAAFTGNMGQFYAANLAKWSGSGINTTGKILNFFTARTPSVPASIFVKYTVGDTKSVDPLLDPKKNQYWGISNIEKNVYQSHITPELKKKNESGKWGR